MFTPMPGIGLLKVPKSVINACIFPIPENFLHVARYIAYIIDRIAHSWFAFTYLVVDIQDHIIQTKLRKIWSNQASKCGIFSSYRFRIVCFVEGVVREMKGNRKLI